MLSNKLISIRLMLCLVVTLSGLLNAGCDRPSSHADSGTQPFLGGAQIGETFVYNLSYAGKGEASLQGILQRNDDASSENAASKQVKIERHIAGRLKITCVRKSLDGVLTSIRFIHPKITLKFGDDRHHEAEIAIAKTLADPILVTFNRSGAVVGILIPPGTNRLGIQALRAVLDELQIVAWDRGVVSGFTWTTQESGTRSNYRAEYTAKLTDDGLRLRKRRIRYDERNTSMNEQFLIEQSTEIDPSSSTEIVLDENRRIVMSIKSKRTESQCLGNRHVSANHVRMTMELVDENKLASECLSELIAYHDNLLEVTKPAPLLVIKFAEEIQREIHTNELGKLTFEDLKKMLDEAASSADPNKATWDLYLKFKALAYLQPSQSQAIATLIARAEPGSQQTYVLAGALGKAGNEEAQKALIWAIQQDWQDWVKLSLLIPTLAEVRHPSLQAEQVIRETAFHHPDRRIASTAELALGTVAHSLRESAPTRSRAIVGELANRVQSAATNDDMEVALLSLGNTRSNAAFPAIAAAADHRSPRIRTIALVALRWIQSAESEEIVLEAAVNDSDQNVRLAAIEVMAFQGPDTDAVSLLQRLAKEDNDESVRMTSLRCLWDKTKAQESTVELVSELAVSDESEMVRRACQDLLSS